MRNKKSFTRFISYCYGYLVFKIISKLFTNSPKTNTKHIFIGKIKFFGDIKYAEYIKEGLDELKKIDINSYNLIQKEITQIHESKYDIVLTVIFGVLYNNKFEVQINNLSPIFFAIFLVKCSFLRTQINNKHYEYLGPGLLRPRGENEFCKRLESLAFETRSVKKFHQ